MFIGPLVLYVVGDYDSEGTTYTFEAPSYKLGGQYLAYLLAVNYIGRVKSLTINGKVLFC